MRILLVEDNAADAFLTVEAFKEVPIPCQVSVVTDGKEALALLRREERYKASLQPDLLLLDLNLPHTDGRTVLAEIRSDPAIKHIPVLIFTSSREENDIESAYKQGANCYLLKPGDLDEFFSLIHAIAEFWGRWAILPTA